MGAWEKEKGIRHCDARASQWLTPSARRSAAWLPSPLRGAHRLRRYRPCGPERRHAAHRAPAGRMSPGTRSVAHAVHNARQWHTDPRPGSCNDLGTAAPFVHQTAGERDGCVKDAPYALNAQRRRYNGRRREHRRHIRTAKHQTAKTPSTKYSRQYIARHNGRKRTERRYGRHTYGSPMTDRCRRERRQRAYGWHRHGPRTTGRNLINPMNTAVDPVGGHTSGTNTAFGPPSSGTARPTNDVDKNHAGRTMASDVRPGPVVGESHPRRIRRKDTPAHIPCGEKDKTYRRPYRPHGKRHAGHTSQATNPCTPPPKKKKRTNAYASIRDTVGAAPRAAPGPGAVAPAGRRPEAP